MKKSVPQTEQKPVSNDESYQYCMLIKMKILNKISVLSHTNDHVFQNIYSSFGNS